MPKYSKSQVVQYILGLPISSQDKEALINNFGLADLANQMLGQ
jgi:hypothetical protein